MWCFHWPIPCSCCYTEVRYSSWVGSSLTSHSGDLYVSVLLSAIFFIQHLQFTLAPIMIKSSELNWTWLLHLQLESRTRQVWLYLVFRGHCWQAWKCLVTNKGTVNDKHSSGLSLFCEAFKNNLVQAGILAESQQWVLLSQTGPLLSCMG